MAKSNPSLTSMTPHAPAERNFVDFHRDHVVKPLNKDLADGGENGMNGKSASAKVKVFNRKKFHMGNNMAASIAKYDPIAHEPTNESLSGTEVSHKKRSRHLNKKHIFVNGPEHKAGPVKEGLTGKGHLKNIEDFYTKRMNDKMDQQEIGQDDPKDIDRTGELSFHKSMRAFGLRTGDKGLAKGGKNQEKHTRAKHAAMLAREAYEKPARVPQRVISDPAAKRVADIADKKKMSQDDVFHAFISQGHGRKSLGKVKKLRAENEEINEISTNLLARYIKKANTNMVNKAFAAGDVQFQSPEKHSKAAMEQVKKGYRDATVRELTPRKKGIATAVDKLVKRDWTVESIESVLRTKINEGKGHNEIPWINSLGNRVSNPSHDKAEVNKSIARHAQKETKKYIKKTNEEIVAEQVSLVKSFVLKKEVVK